MSGCYPGKVSGGCRLKALRPFAVKIDGDLE
jgi:hypothetical protein